LVISFPSFFLILALDESSVGVGVILIVFVLAIAYFVLWIWQIFNARKLAKRFNESVRTTGGKEHGENLNQFFSISYKSNNSVKLLTESSLRKTLSLINKLRKL
jgi:hypothetical protein